MTPEHISKGRGRPSENAQRRRSKQGIETKPMTVVASHDHEYIDKSKRIEP